MRSGMGELAKYPLLGGEQLDALPLEARRRMRANKG